MPVKIHGKDYFTVAERLLAFREDYPDASITTDMLFADSERVIVQAIIRNGDKTCTGLAEEYRDASKINSTSAMENCETSAIGRALAIFSTKYMGAAIASAEEVKRAIELQNGPQHKFKAGEKEEICKQVRDAIYHGNASHLREVWDEMEEQAKLKIWPEFNSTERSSIKKLLEAA